MAVLKQPELGLPVADLIRQVGFPSRHSVTEVVEPRWFGQVTGLSRTEEEDMTTYAGLDVSKEDTAICVRDENGRILWEGKVAHLLCLCRDDRGPGAVRILFFSGTVRNFVCGRAFEHYAAMALMNRSPKMTANWALAMDHSRGGIFHSFSERFKIR